MSVDEVLRQRNQYREELAAVRQERDSHHGLATSLRNRNDHLESENVDLRTQIVDLQTQIAKLSETHQVRLYTFCRDRDR
jgi:predicted  nucleic acid-binding Zn-ribbon protein